MRNTRENALKFLETNKKNMKTGIELIAEERHRQIEVEGYTPKHDAQHWDQSLVRAASCYALGTRKLERQFGNDQNRITVDFDFYPWSDDSWKPTPDNRVMELTKAGALIAAEIDRLLNDENYN